MNRMGKSIVLLLSIMAAFGADKKGDRFTVPRAEEMSGHQQVQGLTVAAQAYTSEAATKQVFGKLNPNRFRVLPVLLVFQNDTGKAIRLERMQVEYQTSYGSAEAVPPGDVPFLRGPDRPKVKVQPIPRISGPKKNPLAAPEIQERAFVAKMLPPNDSAGGFVYFDAEYRGQAKLLITGLTEAATGQELFFFEVPISESR